MANKATRSGNVGGRRLKKKWLHHTTCREKLENIVGQKVHLHKEQE